MLGIESLEEKKLMVPLNGELVIIGFLGQTGSTH